MEYYRKLKLDFNPFDELPEHYFIHDATPPLAMWNKYIDSIHLNKKTRDWFRHNNLILRSSMIFSYAPRCAGAIHIDGFETKEYDYRQWTAINFVQGGHGLMQWFEPIGDIPTTPNLTEVGKSPFFMYNEDNSRLVESYDVADPALVRVDVPHRGINLSDEFKFSITLRWTPKLQWAEAQEKFKSFFL